MRLWLIRHPPPAVPAGICYGASDMPLADDPAPLAATLAALVPAGVPVYSSPLQRCLRLAGLLHPAPIVDHLRQTVGVAPTSPNICLFRGRQTAESYHLAACRATAGSLGGATMSFTLTFMQQGAAMPHKRWEYARSIHAC